jgi:N-acetyl-anhydromuramyl-L-alanine amidase AmpD
VRVWGGILLILMLLWLTRPHRHAPLRPVKPAALHTPPALMIDPPGIVLHNSDSPAKYHGVTVNAARLEAIHAEEHPDWATTCSDGKVYHIGYHYVILPDGTIEKGRPDTCLGTHARTYNDWIGICVIGAFQTNRHWWPRKPTAAQVKSVITLCERLMSKYHIPPELVKRHRDINNTYCPGDRFPYFKILAVLKKYATTHPETRSMPGRVVSLTIPGPHARRTYPANLGTPLTVR